jgi:hypothetical protein
MVHLILMCLLLSRGLKGSHFHDTISKAHGNLIAITARAGILVGAIVLTIADGADIVGSLNDVAVSTL